MLLVTPDGKERELPTTKIVGSIHVNNFKADMSTTGVVITCHNYGMFLSDCLDSLLNQTRPFDKIIIVNDSSTDDTEKKARLYCSKHLNISYLYCDYLDFNKARQLGVTLIKECKYLLFVDADNTISSNFHESLFSKLEEKHDLAVAYPSINYSNGQILNNEFNVDLLRKRNYVDICALIRMQAYTQVFGIKEGFDFSDWHLWLRLTHLGWGMELCNSAKLLYRVHGENMHNKRKLKHPEEALKVVLDTCHTTIITLFSGRLWNLERYIKAILNIDCVKDNIFIIAIDNSCDGEFHSLLQFYLYKSGFNYTLIKDNGKINDNISADKFSDERKHRAAQPREMQTHLARLYAKAKTFVPSFTDFVLSIEDDIVVPRNVLTGFFNSFNKDINISSLAACVQSRFDSRLIGHTGEWNERNPVSVKTIPNTDISLMASGMMCCIFRSEYWNKIVIRESPFDDKCKTPWFDWSIHHMISLNGGKLVLCHKVICAHWTADGYGLLPNNNIIKDEDRNTTERPRVQSKVNMLSSNKGSNGRGFIANSNLQNSLPDNPVFDRSSGPRNIRIS